MTLSLNISEEAKELFTQAWGDKLDQAAFEALVIEGYRSRKFGNSTVRRLLGHETRWDTEKWLAERGITHNYSLEDLQADRDTFKQLFGKSA